MATNEPPKYQLQWKNIGKNNNITGYSYSGELFAFLGKIDDKYNILQSIAFPETNNDINNNNYESNQSYDLLDQSYYQLEHNIKKKEPVIILNNQQLKQSLNNFSYIDISNVNQMYYSLTVIETLIYSSELRNITSQPLITKELTVLRLLTEIGLKDIADKFISSLTIWQCRLVLLAIEIVAMKDIIFFNEPSSDLDAQSALLLLNGLQRIARRNYIIIITASSLTFREYAILDRIQLLSNDGAIYYGYSANALNYFKHLNRTPAPGTSISDFLLDLVDDIITGGKNDMKSLELLCEQNGENCPKFESLTNDITKYNKTYRYIDRYVDIEDNSTINLSNYPISNSTSYYSKYVESIYSTWLWLVNCDCCETNEEDECNISNQPLILKQFIWLLWRSMIIRCRNIDQIVSIWLYAGIIPAISLITVFYSSNYHSNDLLQFDNKLLYVTILPFINVLLSSYLLDNEILNHMIFNYERYQIKSINYQCIFLLTSLLADICIYKLFVILIGNTICYIVLSNQFDFYNYLSYLYYLILISIVSTCLCKFIYTLFLLPNIVKIKLHSIAGNKTENGIPIKVMILSTLVLTCMLLYSGYYTGLIDNSNFSYILRYTSIFYWGCNLLYWNEFKHQQYYNPLTNSMISSEQLLNDHGIIKLSTSYSTSMLWIQALIYTTLYIVLNIICHKDINEYIHSYISKIYHSIYQYFSRFIN